MSLEATIAENTSAIRELIAALLKSPAAPEPSRGVAPAVMAAALDATDKAEKKKEVKPKAAAENPTTPSATTAPGSEAEASQPATTSAPTTAAPAAKVELVRVQQALMALSKAKGRDAVIEVLGRFGAPRGSDIDPADYPAALAAFEEAARG